MEKLKVNLMLIDNTNLYIDNNSYADIYLHTDVVTGLVSQITIVHNNRDVFNPDIDFINVIVNKSSSVHLEKNLLKWEEWLSLIYEMMESATKIGTTIKTFYCVIEQYINRFKTTCIEYVKP